MTTIKKSHCIEYAVLRCVETAVNIMPRGAALFLGGLTGQALYLSGVYRRVVLKNFEHVGLWNADEVKKILPKLYKNIGRYAVDFLRVGKLPPYRLHDYDIYERGREAGKGMIIVLAHFGNWELLAAIWGKDVGDLNVVAMPMRNPLVEKWLLKKRTATAVKTIYTEKALRGVLSALKRNGIAAILIDQHINNMGTPTPFLGKTADTVRTAAGLAYKTGAAAVPVHSILNPDGSYDIKFYRAELPAVGADGAGKADDETVISAIQVQHNDILSGWIRENPEHWFGWFHRRFKGYVDYRIK
jgi:KDO2-lipid IV(A) lauroyltransferase